MAQSTRNPRRRLTARRLLTAALGLTACAVVFPIPKARAAPITEFVLSEIMYNPRGCNDSGNEWIELFNGTDAVIDLANFSIGYGGNDYTMGTIQLSGIIAPDEYFVIGSGVGYDLDVLFDPTLQNPLLFADGVALFDIPAIAITATTIPIDAVIYNSNDVFGNPSGLLDPAGNPGAVDVAAAPAGQSIALSDTGWVVESAPSPGSGILGVPEPKTGLLLLLGLAVLARRLALQRDTRLG